MKKRNITYGYVIRDGVLQPHPQESEIVKEIFRRYAERGSLRTLAEDLTRRGVEFFPGKSNWDKARVKRVLDERRYYGEKGFPKLIEGTLFRQTEAKKQQSSTAINPDSAIKKIKDLMRCAGCGNRLNLKCDYRLANPEAWYCKNCGITIRISHQALKSQLLELQCQMLAHPESILEREETGNIVSLEARKLTHELHRRMDAGNASEEELIQMALECAAETYQGIHSARHIADRLMAVLRQSGPLSAFDPDLLRAVTRRIALSGEGKITLELKNGRWYGKEIEDDRHSGTEQGDGDPGQAPGGVAE